jgi:hypothetical protein
MLDEKQDDSPLAKKARRIIKEKKVAIRAEGIVPRGFQLVPILDNLKKDAKISYDDFQKAFCDHLTTLPDELRSYTVIFPLNFQITKRIENTLDEMAFKIIRFDEFVSDFAEIEEAQKWDGKWDDHDVCV